MVVPSRDKNLTNDNKKVLISANNRCIVELTNDNQYQLNERLFLRRWQHETVDKEFEDCCQ